MALLGIRVPTSLSKTLRGIDVPGQMEDTSDFHVTLFIFDKHMDVSDVAKSVEAVSHAIKNIKPFTIKVNNISCFPKREDNPVPIISPLDSKELQELRKKIKRSLTKSNVKFNDNFKDYKPHITISYADEEVEEFDIDEEEFKVENIVLWSGDEGLNEKHLFVTFPLDEKKNATLLRKIEYFYKMAAHL